MHNIKDERSNNDLIERLCQLSGVLFDASSSSGGGGGYVIGFNWIGPLPPLSP